MNGPNRRAAHRQAFPRRAAEPAPMDAAPRPAWHVHIDTLALHGIAGSAAAYADAVRGALASALAGPAQSNGSDPDATARAIAEAVRSQIRPHRV